MQMRVTLLFPGICLLDYVGQHIDMRHIKLGGAVRIYFVSGVCPYMQTVLGFVSFVWFCAMFVCLKL